MNGLNDRQNEQASIDKLAAQNQIYGDAKARLGIYLFLSVPVVMVLNLVVKPAFINDWFGFGHTFDLTDSIALYGVLLAGYELVFLRGYISKLKQKAAKIQEEFDCSVYQLEWNNILCGNKVCEREIKRSSNIYSSKGKARNRFVDWYTPEVQLVDNIKGVLLCQKENLGWDIDQREKFVYFVTFSASLVFVSSLIIGFYFELTLKSLILSALIPSWPAISFSITNYLENKEAIQDKKDLMSAVGSVAEIKSPTVKYTRNIQNVIYLNRKNNCLIFDWFYDYLRDSNQEGVSYASKQLVRRLL